MEGIIPFLKSKESKERGRNKNKTSLQNLQQTRAVHTLDRDRNLHICKNNRILGGLEKEKLGGRYDDNMLVNM